MGYFRHPLTQQERRQGSDKEVRAYIRHKRRPKRLPSLWDDIHVASREDRSWKRYRKTKWR